MGFVAMSIYQFLPTGHYAFYSSVIATLCIIFVSYTSCIVACYVQLRDQALSTNQRRQYHTEMKFMFQAMTLACIIVVEESSYHLTNGGLVYQVLYMVYGGLAPIVHLVTNSEIRNLLKNLICKHLLRRNNVVSQVT
uniref:Uncharacterized protein n=1 Tax=Romanomermis culicivorax TaxID=13658 RepID=A0A915J9A3_ROMCU